MLLDDHAFSGTAVEYWSNGTLASEMPFAQGLQHGVTYGWHSNGVLGEETQYFCGCARGLRTEWHPNGQLKLRESIDERGFCKDRSEWDTHGQQIYPTALPSRP